MWPTILIASGAAYALKLVGYVVPKGSVTPAELRVARAVADGGSNAEVAASLFITRKAVEYHLSNIYRKLQISGRSQLAGALAAASP